MPMEKRHEWFMDLALEEARGAQEEGEVPVGAVAVLNGEVLARARNRKETWNDPTAHAEILAIREAARKLGRWRLYGVCLYVTMEPCALCAGAIVQARISTLVFGCRDPKAGACGSVFSIVQDDRLNHWVEVISGIREEECARLLREFFQELRERGQSPARVVLQHAKSPCT